MVRIFISSTFKNFEEERNGLVTVFQELSELCKTAGFSFQVLDLRWGISEEDGHDNRTLPICFDEIARCQTLSPKPNFLILSGLYYGWVPLPSFITKYVWNEIADDIPTSSLLRDWYLQDENDAEYTYILRPRRGEERNKSKWSKIEESLKEELFPLVRKHFSDESEHFDIWGLSATEQEIYKGLFCHPENREHVFVLMRTKEPEGCIYSEPEDSLARAITLQEHLKNNMGTLTDTNVLSYQPGDDYTQKVGSFLKQVIQSRIDETLTKEAALTPFQREQSLLDEAVLLAEGDYVEVNHNQNNFLNHCKRNSGRVILLTGRSGSGKSMLLKHCYYKAQGNFVFSCADILPSCSSISHALWFCLKQLETKGMLSAVNNEPDAEQCVVWFEKQLTGFHNDTPVTILLDSVDQIRDWNQIGGSLLACRLPKKLTLVISCISENSLNERDCIRDIFSYSLQPLTSHDSIRLLKQLLHNRGRILHEEDEQFILTGLPTAVTPLYMQMLCQQLQKRRSFDCRPLELPVGTEESIYTQLKTQGQNHPVLYRHAIGYLALAVDGLSEQELLELLEKDECVIQETEALSHWKIRQSVFTLSVLWARIFYDLRHYLSAVDSNGILLLRFHHDLVRRTAMEMVGQHLLMQLSKKMSRYFLAEPVYLGNTKNPTIVNTRKLRELLPALIYQNDWSTIASVLADPEYVDGYLRCGWYRDLMQQFMELGQQKYLQDVHRNLLLLLHSKAMQFQLWGDSFIPAYATSFKYPFNQLIDLGWRYILQNSSPRLAERENSLQQKIPLPNAVNVRIAVKDDGTLAIMDGKVLKRYDLELQSEIYPRCYIDVVNAFLYWKGNTLFVRDESCRITFHDTGSELVQVKKEKCSSLVDLYSDDIENIIHAGGFDERDSEGYFTETVFQYQSNGTLKGTELFYPEIEEVRCFCHGNMCAVLLDQYELEIVDLEQRLLLVSYPVPNACFVYWNPQGTEVLVVFETNKVLRLPCSYEHSVPLTRPSMSMKKHAKAYRKHIERREILNIFQFSCPVNKGDTPAYIGSVLGSRRPVYAAFTIQGDRLACYYYYLNQGVIRLFRLSNREFLAESTVDPIFWNDSVGRPIYFNADGTTLILISRGKQHIWKMDSLKWDHNTQGTAESQIEFVHSLQLKYADCMNPWLPSGNQVIARHKSGILRIVRKAIMLLLSPLICSKEIKKSHETLLRQSIQQVTVLESGGFWWILDRHHSMIHVCDQKGQWVCHEQLQEEIFNFDVIDHTVYALPMDLSNPIQLTLSSFDI